MQVPFHNAFNQRFPPPNRYQYQWRPGFIPRSSPSRFRAPAPHWRQPPPQTNEFWCETCDRGFRTSDILEKHKQQHQKCNIDGCQFIAHPKVITKHIQMQHASGLYKKIAKLQDPEEIKKWREERKKKYPTKENVEKAAAAIKEKIERGEKMGMKSKRHEKTLISSSGVGGKKQHCNKRHNRMFQNSVHESKRRKITPKNVKKLPVAEDPRKLKPFAGIQELMVETDEQQDEQQDELECNFTIEDEDELADPHIPSEAPSGSVCHALSSLICNYGSSDEDEVPTISNTPSSVTNTKTPTSTLTLNQIAERKDVEVKKTMDKQLSLHAKNESDDDSGPEEVKVTKPVITEIENMDIKTEPFINKRKIRDKPLQKPVFKRPKPKIPSTLLQKLLFKEMKHERNIVLQCVRHIIRNNFFDKS